MINMFECFYHSSPFKDSDLSSLFQNKATLNVSNFVWPFNRGKDNRKPSLGRPKGCHDRLTEVAGFTVFY